MCSWVINMELPYYCRFLEDSFAPDSIRSHGPSKVLLLLGARQSGKSTLLNHCVDDSETTLKINLQDRRVRRRYEVDEGLLIRELEAAPELSTVVIDEIQKVPGLLDDVQFLYDQDPARFRFFLSGSSARQLKRGSANLLPGRVHNLLLSTVLQAEQRECALLPLPMKRANDLFPLRELDDYLLYGNLPGLYHEERSSWSATLLAYVDLYIENEIRRENIVDDMGAFQRFLRLAALESGQRVNHTRLASAVGVATNTLRNYYQVLEDTYVGIRIHPFGRSRKKVLAAPRFLIFDIGVRHVLAELPINNTLLSLDAGHIFEQWVLNELICRCRYAGRGYRLSTWHTSTGAEVDGVIETPTEVIPVEVKWTDRPSPSDARHVETFIKLHGTLANRGFVVCRAPRKQKLTEHVIAIPWNEF